MRTNSPYLICFFWWLLTTWLLISTVKRWKNESSCFHFAAFSLNLLHFHPVFLTFCIPLHLGVPPVSSVSLAASHILTPSSLCEQLNVYFMSASSSILTGPLLGGFAPLFHILFVPLFAVSIKDEIEISCANTHQMQRLTETQSELCFGVWKSTHHLSYFFLPYLLLIRHHWVFLVLYLLQVRKQTPLSCFYVVWFIFCFVKGNDSSAFSQSGTFQHV